MTDAEIMDLYEQGLSLDHIARRVVAREANTAKPPKLNIALTRVRTTIYRELIRRKMDESPEP